MPIFYLKNRLKCLEGWWLDSFKGNSHQSQLRFESQLWKKVSERRNGWKFWKDDTKDLAIHRKRVLHHRPPPISVRFLYIYFAASIESKILNQIFHLSLRNILKATTIIKRLHREREREEETISILIFCFQLERRKKKRRPTLLLLLLLPWKFHFLAISEPFIYFFFFLIWNGHVSAQRRLKVCSKPKRTQR